jgi:hypothetical protein
MTSWSASSGLDAVKAFYDKGGTGRDAFTYFDIGINPAIQRVAGSAMWTYAQAGMVSMGIGGDTFFGGNNTSPFGFASYVLNATVTVDDKPIVKNGTLVIDEVAKGGPAASWRRARRFHARGASVPLECAGKQRWWRGPGVASSDCRASLHRNFGPEKLHPLRLPSRQTLEGTDPVRRAVARWPVVAGASGAQVRAPT